MGYHSIFKPANIVDTLEIHAILGFKNILAYQMIYAVILDFGFIDIM